MNKKLSYRLYQYNRNNHFLDLLNYKYNPQQFVKVFNEFLKDDDSTYKNFIEIYVNISPTSSPSPSPTSNIFLIFIDLGIVGRKYVIIIKLSW